MLTRFKLFTPANCLRLMTLVVLVCLAAGCGAIAGKNNTGVIVARSAQIRSSTAVVAADLLEVLRSDTVDILDYVDIPDPNDNSRKERWYRVRAHDADKTEGWIEARNIMLDKVVENSRKLYEEDKGIAGQATGQLRASSNLRLTPDRGNNENIMMRLDSGSSFEILSWKRVPKQPGSDTDTDVAPKPGTVSQVPNARLQDDEAPAEEQETTELWYKVRLPPSICPAPEGWIYGKQVELTVPSDIIYYRRGRDFVAWRRLDSDENADDISKSKDVGRETKPGSWVILEKSSSKEGHKPDEPDFDRIYVLGYDKRDQDHYTAYLSADVKGYLPLRTEGRGANKTFIVRLQDDNGQIKEQQYSLYRDDHGVMRVLAPGETRETKEKKPR